jgi:hypothetical protein
MQIYFDEVDPKILDETGGSAFAYNGRFYDYRITVETDNVVLEDSVGRMIPFAHQNIAGLHRAVCNIKDLSSTLAAAEALMDSLEEDQVITIS